MSRLRLPFSLLLSLSVGLAAATATDGPPRLPAEDILLFLQATGNWESRRLEYMRSLFGEDFPTTNSRYGAEAIRLVMVPVLLDLQAVCRFYPIASIPLREIRNNYLANLSSQVGFFTNWAESATNHRASERERRAISNLLDATEKNARHRESIDALRGQLGLAPPRQPL